MPLYHVLNNFAPQETNLKDNILLAIDEKVLLESWRHVIVNLHTNRLSEKSMQWLLFNFKSI